MNSIITIIITLTCIYNSFAQPYDNIYIPSARYQANLFDTPLYFEKVHSDLISFSSISGRYTSIAEKNKLLFACDGTTVLDKDQQIMQNGRDLLGDRDAYFSSLAIRNVKNNNRYFIFTGKGHETTTEEEGKLYYSEVDLDANGGKGEVRISTKNTLISENMLNMYAYIPTCFGYWLITKENSSRFKVFRIDKNGISANPVISDVAENLVYGYKNGALVYDEAGEMDISFDGKLVVLTYGSLRNYYDLFRFDDQTGQVSFLRRENLDFPNEIAHPIVFNRNKLNYYYLTVNGRSRVIYKVELNEDYTVRNKFKYFEYLNPVNHITASHPFQVDYYNNIITSINWQIIRISEDGTKIDTLSNEQIAPPGLLLGRQFSPPHKVVYFPELIHRDGGDTIKKCPEEIVKLYAGSKLEDVVWNNNWQGDTLEVLQAGMYVMSGRDEFCTYLDTIYVENYIQDTNLQKSYNLCDDLGIKISLPSIYEEVKWHGFEENDPLFTSPGQYSFEAKIGNCFIHDTIQINNLQNISLINDTVICTGASLEVRLDTHLSNIVWNDNNVETFRMLGSGTYSYTALNGTCPVFDSFQIIPVPEIVFEKQLGICPNESLVFTTPIELTNFFWRDGTQLINNQRIFNTPGQYSFTAINDLCLIEDTITIFSKSANLYEIEDTTLCADISLELNLPFDYEDIKWSDGSTQNSNSFIEEGLYFYQAKSNGCMINDSFNLMKYPKLDPPLNEAFINICKGDSLPKIAGIIWVNPYEIPPTEGEYYYLHTDTLNCTSSYAIDIKLNDCEMCNPVLPNIMYISNDRLLTIGNPCNLSFDLFSLFDRWGNKICELIPINGEINLCETFGSIEDGVYVYTLKGADERDKPFVFRSTITVLK
ncbi:MAG: hypothetical protein IPL23_29390 [Saprospiraceae bacterium]|nr:hypothetical protein [Saprospiraceae bacterium]